MKLSRRLETIASMVPRLGPGSCVADVGTDHGFVPIWLVRQGICERALAMDVREGPLQRAREHIVQYGIEGRIETRLSDGLSGLRPGEAQAVVIAGMGGELMLRILREGAAVRGGIGGWDRTGTAGDDDLVRTGTAGGGIAHWILAPQSELSLFRHGLEELGIAIREEAMVFEDGKYYPVIYGVPGTMHYEREYQYRYGDCLIRQKSPVLRELLERERTQYRGILAALAGQEGSGAKKRCLEIQQELEEMEAAYDAMQGTD